jgi:hypothetical protein
VNSNGDTKDRCLVILTTGPDLKAKMTALKAVVKQWVLVSPASFARRAFDRVSTA